MTRPDLDLLVTMCEAAESDDSDGLKPIPSDMVAIDTAGLRSLIADAKLGRLAREVAKASRVLATVHALGEWRAKHEALEAERDSLRQNVNRRDAFLGVAEDRIGALEAAAQEVRRAWDRFMSGVVHEPGRDLRTTIDALCPAAPVPEDKKESAP